MLSEFCVWNVNNLPILYVWYVHNINIIQTDFSYKW